MTTKTTDLWLSRDPDGSYWVSEQEPHKYVRADFWAWYAEEGPIAQVRDRDWMRFYPSLRKGTKRPIRVTVEVLR